MSKIDGVLNNVHLGVEVGGDVHGRVGNDERLLVSRHVHDEAVADPALGANTAFPRDHRSHEFVGVEAALHQRLDPPGRNEAHRLRR